MHVNSSLIVRGCRRTESTPMLEGGATIQGDGGEGVWNCPLLAPVGALLGTLGYATGTVLAWLTGLMLRHLAGAGRGRRSSGRTRCKGARESPMIDFEDKVNQVYRGPERRRGTDRRVGNDRRRDIRFELDKDDRRNGRDRRRNIGGWGSMSTV